MKAISNTTELGAVIREKRKEQGLTQEQLASISGVGVRFIRELEQGKESCHLGKAMSVISMLGINIKLEGRSI